MNDYEFGNALYKYRVAANFSQAQLGELLGVTNKAVSKWENGKTKPSTQILRKLAVLYNIPIEKLLILKEDVKQVTINKIVITGGPCAGKTTAMSWIQNAFDKKGYKVLFIPETATELITGGVAPWTCGSNQDFQYCQVKLQTAKEQIFEKAAASMGAEKVLIVCDRGALDNKAYMSALEFQITLRELNLNEIELRDGYDAVFHLTTAAKGAQEAYTLANNAARTETIEQAIELDDKLIQAWVGHPHLRVTDNSTDFETKLQRVIAEISSFLGEPEPFEIERKFLIKYPDLNYLDSLPNCQKIEIIQTYLKSHNDNELRVRQRGLDGNYVYYLTEKVNISSIKRIETERRLSKDEYLHMLMDADTSLRQIRKTRYCLSYENQYLEIDIYPFWNDKAILEIELSCENEPHHIPKYLHVIKEVTNDESYRNYSLAQQI